MTRRDQESLTGLDPHSALFGDSEADTDADGPADWGEPQSYRPTRADRRAYERERDGRRRSRRGWVIVLFTLVVVAVVGVGGFYVIRNYFTTDDYSGNGASYPTVTITVRQGDSAADIGNTLKGAGVVESATAFTDAASDNSDSSSIQPGVYSVHKHQSGKNALAALLNPSSRDATNDVLVVEGDTSYAVQASLAKVLGGDSSGAIADALKNPKSLGLPLTYLADGKTPTSAEGFLFPATYTFDPGTNPAEALTTMVSRFIQADRDSGFSADANSQGTTPYEALIVASIIQGEAKFDEDMPKVAEVIYNRLQDHSPLQIDATTKYGCEVAGQPASKCRYDTFSSPYNSYTNKGLPPTPIDNPGASAMNAAVHPATGTLKFYVNGDKAGHLAFSSNATDFEKDRQRCHDNGWGCA